MEKRASGILLHVTSLPSRFGVGDLGPAAYRFIDFLKEAKQQYWQVLPLTYTHQSHGNSPYSSIAAFAGNPVLISPELLADDGLLTKEDLALPVRFPAGRVDYEKAIKAKFALFNKAYENFERRPDKAAYEQFCGENDWVEEFALFAVLRAHFKGRLWAEWPRELRDRDPGSLEAARRKFSGLIEREKFFQYLFFRQWTALRNYCAAGGIKVIGDIPIYVSYDSVDVWAHPELFKLDAEKRLLSVAGVPPDYFSATGQRWGNPVYNWAAAKESGYAWWIRRLAQNFKLFDMVRIDHFRGFVAYWEIPSHEQTAVNGRWEPGPGAGFFAAVIDHFHSLPIIAEDLGIITPDVKEVIRHFHFPGMRVLLFAFGDDFPNSLYLPHNYDHNCVVYTGTHDNNTVRGWFEEESTPEQREQFFRYIGKPVAARQAGGEFVRLALASCADLSVFPLQDVLGLGARARMNMPATSHGNWQWRFAPGSLTKEAAEALAGITVTYGRAT